MEFNLDEYNTEMKKLSDKHISSFYDDIKKIWKNLEKKKDEKMKKIISASQENSDFFKNLKDESKFIISSPGAVEYFKEHLENICCISKIQIEEITSDSLFLSALYRFIIH